VSPAEDRRIKSALTWAMHGTGGFTEPSDRVALLAAQVIARAVVFGAFVVADAILEERSAHTVRKPT